MNKKFLSVSFIFCVLLTSSNGFAMDLALAQPVSCELEKSELLTKAAQDYTEFLSQFGRDDIGDIASKMNSIFTLGCHKIVNGPVVTRTIPELYTQILTTKGGKDSIGTWTVIPVTPFVVSPERNLAVVHYEIPTERGGTIVVIKFLKCNSKGLIEEINEVWNKKGISTASNSIAADQAPAQPAASKQEKIDLLTKAAQSYTDFLSQFGRADIGDIASKMYSTFTLNCHKIVNGTIVTSTIPELSTQILTTKNGKDGIGTWTVTAVTPFVVSPERNLAVVHYEIPTERGGTIVVIKFLKCNSKGLIEEINEVWNKK